ncbi:MAG: primosomal protein N' [Candidatus Hydrogenedentota bacterium]|nr:MAG: primosomal protein N' [Candidatus Hydrogenedentota bacterium]
MSTEPREPSAEFPHFLSVLVPIPGIEGEAFTYRAAEEIPQGERVRVPLGRRNTIGFVLGSAQPLENAKPILGRADGFAALTGELIEITRWMARRYHVSWYRCVETVLPAGLRFRKGIGRKRRRVLEPTLPIEKIEPLLRKDERMLSAVRFLEEYPGTVTVAELARKFELGRTRIDTLVRKGILRAREVEVDRRPRLPRGAFTSSAKPLPLTEEQRFARERIRALARSGGGTLLLRGVTGSGKTEVYLQSIAEFLEKGKTAIVLVPEISLTPLTLERFRSRFGDRIAVLHSALSEGERLDEWLRVKRGRAQVVIGARSAVFAPVENLGLIVIDEAHEASYKQSDSPRYNALDIARFRAERHGAVVLLGTATPGIEMICDTKETIHLPRRVRGSPPEVALIDMRRELIEGNRSVFSRRLRSEIRKVLERREQAILFLNRRGHSSFVLCRNCGETVRCPRCDVSLTLHERPGKKVLVCHICNHRGNPPRTCPACSSRKIRDFGAGTQFLQKEVERRFPGARVARMDADTTVKKGAHQKILEAFAEGEYDILVGTQMIGKGHDFPRVTLVGVLAAESSLHLPDFRAPERTFQQILQVIGRAGRSERGGVAVIQAYKPEHYAVSCAARGRLDEFLEQERAIRSASGLPPFRRLLLWTVSARREGAAREEAFALVRRLEGIPGELLGPAPAPLERIRERWRWQVRWLFDPELDEEEIENWLRKASPEEKNTSRGREKGGDDLRIIADVDPIDVL